MNYFLKGLLRIPIIIVKGCLSPIILLIWILIGIYDSICKLGGKKYGDFEATFCELFITRWVWV